LKAPLHRRKPGLSAKDNQEKENHVMKALERIYVWPVIFLWLSGTCYAQGVLKELPPGKWWKTRRVIQQLQLSPEQQQKIDSIWMEDRKDLIDQKAEFDKSQLDLSELISKDAVDEAAALAAFDRMQAARRQLERQTFLMRIRIKNVLTQQQQQKLEQISEFLRRNRNAAPPAPSRGIPNPARPRAGAVPPP
jgi:Spy/CpxP family protein refolding chaperone